MIYKNGNAVSGKSVDYDDAGKMVAERQFENEKVTLERSYYQNGKVREESTCNADRWMLKTYHDNGKLEREVPCVNGGSYYWSSRAYEGLEKSYDVDGKLWEEAEYRHGQRHGTTKRYTHGKPYANSTYKDGSLITETYYDEQGRLVSSTEYHRDGSKK